MKSQNDLLAAIFQQNPNTWLSMTDLGVQIGAWAVHSRVSDLRKMHCMNIESHKTKDYATGKVISFYRWIPANSKI